MIQNVIRQALELRLGQILVRRHFGRRIVSKDMFARRGVALRFQLALRSQPIIKVVTGVASPIQIRLISTMLDLFGFRILFAVGV